MKIDLNNITLDYTIDEKGNFIYKSINVVPFKKNGNLKAKYADLPRYKVILVYEQHTVDLFTKEVLLKSVKEINNKLNGI